MAILNYFLYAVSGVIVGTVSMLFLPRWEYFDKFYQGLGLLLPILLFSLAILAIFFYFDSPPDRWKRELLFVIFEFATFAWLISSMKIGF